MTRSFIIAALLSTLAFVCAACGSDSATGPPGAPVPITIDVRYTSTLAEGQRDLVANAVDKWRRALSKAPEDFRLNVPANACFAGQPKLNETHHGLLLFISVAPVDGPFGVLAFTQVCSVSGSDMLPMLSHIRLDKDDLSQMRADGVLRGVIMHEMAHALGFSPGTYTLKGLSGGGTSDPFFSGATARAEFAKHGAWYTGVTVPLENTTGTGPRDPHWRYNVFRDELMVPSVSRGYRSPLSSITLGLFKDLGYEVDFSAADSYEVTPLFGGDRILPEANLRNDVVSGRPPMVVNPIATY
jgi:hypothetical protein